MARKDTNKQYSLRKLKTGTASVAVAVAVLGAGFANQTEVKAAESPKSTETSANGADKLADAYNTLLTEHEKLRDEYYTLIDAKEEEPRYKALRGENQDLREKEGKYQDKIKN
ncbi:Gram-positive signal peptide protein, YSIRK family [Streptococcus pyogenes UTMEM-1]|nr:Gram-positive signal peptide protein, YSIRK family [Streptococcus pyogenes UTSW-2]EQL80935.1 Gram-positive signal peptide protein, YSIRK family [Streptococcus pyogenes UTMEM-1]ESA56335.1 Gram-positive signal peptide protein, YSIRK family [Streptococcus pyogenes GA40377]